MKLNIRLVLLLLLISPLLSPSLPLVKGAGPNVAKTRTWHLIDSNGWYNVFGQIENFTDSGIAYVTTTFRAANGSVLGNVLTYVMLDIVKINENASFNVIFADVTKSLLVTDYDFSIGFNTLSGNDPSRLAFTYANTTDSGHLRTTGTVTNDIGRTAYFVQVIGTFYRSDWTVVYASWVYPNSFNVTSPGSSTFEIIALNNTAIAHTRLLVQCTQYATAPISDFALRIVGSRTGSVTQGSSITYDVRIIPNPKINYSVNWVTLSASGLPQGANATFSPSNSLPFGTGVGLQAILNITTSSAVGVGVGTFQISISGNSGGLTHSVPVFLTVSAGYDFALSLSPSQTVSQNAGPATFTITATSSGGFSSTVTLNYSNIPSGSTANFSSSTIVPTPSGATTTFRVYVNSSTALGAKLFTICGRGGSPEMSHCVQGSVTVTLPTTPSFTLSISPSTHTVSQNSSTIYTVTVGSTNGFHAPVSLTLGGNPTGTTGTFSTSPVTPPSNGNGQSTLTITTSPTPLYGTYNLTVTGTSPSYPTKIASTTLIVMLFTEPDFALYALPMTLSVVQNNSGLATIQVVSINSFTGSVDLSVQNLPSGVTHSIVNPSVTPLEGGYVYTKLNLQTSSSTPLGSYDLTIRGTSGTKTHTVPLTLQVINKTSPLPFKCIIATATYGSEMSPEVQYLRGFRDGRVLTTYAGTEFMKVFNAWYYSFSPHVASWITDNPASQGPARVVIMPLLGILRLSETAYSALGFAPETAVTLAGVIASFLIGMLYFGPILAFAYRLLDQDRFRKVLVCGALTLVGSLILLTIGLSALLPTLVMLASSILVLSTVTLGSCSTYMLTSRILSKIRLVG